MNVPPFLLFYHSIYCWVQHHEVWNWITNIPLLSLGQLSHPCPFLLPISWRTPSYWLSVGLERQLQCCGRTAQQQPKHWCLINSFHLQSTVLWRMLWGRLIPSQPDPRQVDLQIIIFPQNNDSFSWRHHGVWRTWWTQHCNSHDKLSDTLCFREILYTWKSQYRREMFAGCFLSVQRPLFAMKRVLADNGAGCCSQAWKPTLFQLRDCRVSDASSQSSRYSVALMWNLQAVFGGHSALG